MSAMSLIPSRFFNVTPSDTLPVGATLGLYVGVGGTVRLAGADGVEATFTVNAGQYLSGRIHRVLATGTTASGIVGLSV